VKNNLPVLLLFLCAVFQLQSQVSDTLTAVNGNGNLVAGQIIVDEYDPLAPSRTAFYSAVIPGLGQAYNEKYWKIPIIYAGIGTGIYFYSTNRSDNIRFRDAYKRRLAGYTDDEFQGIANETLIRAQRNTRRNMDVSLAVAVGFYLLNIVDANVDAHLKQYNVSEDLSLGPQIDYNPYLGTNNYGLSLAYKLW
jgi:hypothetical protein